MARPDKRTVDYFPFYVKDGRTLFILESKYGCKGTGFFTNLLRFLCETPDHHYRITNQSDKLYFFSKVKCDVESGMDMLNMMAATGKIDAGYWVSGVIYSDDFIKSIEDAYRKRSNKPLLRDQVSVIYKLTAEETKLTAEEIPVSGVHNPQRKEKKRKEKKNYTQEFLIFWDAYPVKIGKDKAADAWLNRNEDRPPLEKILEAIKAQKAWRLNAGSEFRPEWKHPTTWINQGCWADEIPKTTYKEKPKQKNPFIMCSKCGEEYLETDIIDINGSMYCPKCPESREAFNGGGDRVKGLISGIGRASP